VNAHVRQRLDRHRRWLEEHEPKMHLAVDDQAERAKIVGRISVPVGGGRARSFAIELRYQRKNDRLNPFLPPETHDPDEQFEPHRDRHIRQEDGWFCMWLPQRAPDDFDKPDGLARHFERVREFLLLQLMFDDRRRRNLKPYWPGEQWSHGSDGHRQWVRERIDGLDADQLRRLMREASAERRRRPVSPCPCRSGLPYRLCHRDWVLAIRGAWGYEAVADELGVVLREQDALAS
jgi:hypothetical protein